MLSHCLLNLLIIICIASDVEGNFCVSVENREVPSHVHSGLGDPEQRDQS